MVSKKRRLIKRVQTGLEKQKVKLGPDEAKIKKDQTILRMVVKANLDRLGIKDTKKRRDIHDIMQRMGNRIRMLLQTKTVNKPMAAVKRGFGDLHISQCRKELIDQLGYSTASKFLKKVLLSQLYLKVIMREKKKKE